MSARQAFCCKNPHADCVGITTKEEGKAVRKRILVGLTAILLVFGLLIIGDDGGEALQEDTYEEQDGSNAAAPQTEERDTVPEAVAKESFGSTESGWTLMIYLCGSDLESENGVSSFNIEEMCFAELTEDVSVLVETGGSGFWQWDNVDPAVLQRFALSDGELKEVESLESASMGEASTLSDFLNFGISNYPNPHYGVILWDHGGGNAEGVCYDELYDYDNLTMEELREALDAAPAVFDFIGFDACLMASLETAKASADAGYYMVASEETEPGYGWDYTTLLTALAEEPSMPGDALGRVVCDSFLEKCEAMDCADQATLSVIDLSMIGTLDAAFDSYTGGMALAAEDIRTLNSVSSGAGKAESYGGNTREEGYCNMVDMADLVRNTQDYLSVDGSDLLASISRTVLYEVHGDSRENSNGISVFYPIEVSPYEFEAYAESSDNIPYLQYIAAVTDSYDSFDWDASWEQFSSVLSSEEAYWEGEDDDSGNDSDSTVTIAQQIEALQDSLIHLDPITSDDFKLEYRQSLNDDGVLELEITSGLDAVKSVQFLLWYETDGSETDIASEYVYLGGDNNVNADWENGIFTDNFTGEWMSIGGEYVSAELIEETGNYNLYSIPANVNGADTNLRAVYNFNSGAYRVLGTYDGMDSGNSALSVTSRGIQPLKENDEVIFYLPAYNIDTEEESVYISDPVTWHADTVMEDVELGDGFFLYMYEIKDLYGNEYDTDPVEMQVDGDTILPYQTP